MAEVQLDQVDSYSLASLLKLYLRELPKALIDDSIVARLYNAVDLCKSTADWMGYSLFNSSHWEFRDRSKYDEDGIRLIASRPLVYSPISHQPSFTVTNTCTRQELI